MGTWNYRVIRSKSKSPFDPGDIYAIHEVYYDDARRPDGVTESPIAPYGHSVRELREVLHRMLRALDKKVMDYDEF